MKRVQLKEIIDQLADVKFVGDENHYIKMPVNFDVHNMDEGALMWVNTKNKNKIAFVKTGTIISSEISQSEIVSSCNYIFSDQPRKVFATILRLFFVNPIKREISQKASIHSSVQIGENCSIDDFCVLKSNVKIGNNVLIGSNTVINENVVIGNDVVIGSNCTIGGVGFGYEKDDNEEYVLIPHIGNVIVNDRVEIGNNTTIDRAVMGSTILHENVKVDNLVHIAHGVVIGRNSLIIANAMIAGSTIIGENVWVAPSSSIINKVIISNNSTVGLAAVVVKNVKNGDTVFGNPARSILK